MSDIKKVETNTFLGKKRQKKSSDEKKVSVYSNDGINETLKEEKSFKTVEDFDKYLSSLKNPFTIDEGKILELNNFKIRDTVFKNEILNKIYEKEDSPELYDDYKMYQFLYIDPKEEIIKPPNPMSLNLLLIGPKFFFNIPEKNCPKFYKSSDDHLINLYSFLSSGGNLLFHLYMRKKAGTTLYLMKQMERKHEVFIYFDLRKLNEIIFISKKNANEFNSQFKKFIFYSLFDIESIYFNTDEVFERIKTYFYFIMTKIQLKLPIDNANKFIQTLFESYILLYKEYLSAKLLLEKENRFKMLIFIIDHYNYEIESDYINKILKENNNGTLQFLIEHTLNNKKTISEFFHILEDNTFQKMNEGLSNFTKGVELKKNQTIIGYYEEMYSFDERNFDDKDLKILKLYKEELLDNFGLNNPSYFFRFIDYMKDKKQDSKDSAIFKKFLKIISTEIELDIRLFYDNSLENENFYMSKYYDMYLKKFPESDKKQIENIKKNIPLDYFILKFDKKEKEILEIYPSCNLVKKIIENMSKKFSAIIYQSKFYEEENQSGKGNILRKTIEDIIEYEPSILLNYMEKNLIFKLDYIIPSAENIGSGMKDPVQNYYNALSGKKQVNTDILSFITETEKNDMEKLSKILDKDNYSYNNIILNENDASAKNYNLGIIKFTGKNSYVLLIFQITVSREKTKFSGVNMNLERDIAYIISKIERYLKNYKSEDVHLIYVLDKDEDKDLNINDKNESQLKDSENIKKKSSEKKISKQDTGKYDIDFKSGLNAALTNNVHLIYFGRKYLKFISEEGKIIKELIYTNKNINFVTSDINQYFLDEYIQKIFNKTIKIYNIEIGKMFIDLYDYTDKIGNLLIITKINNKKVTVVVIVKGKTIHSTEIDDGIMQENANNELNYPEKESYYFEIINPEKVNVISHFPPINIEK